MYELSSSEVGIYIMNSSISLRGTWFKKTIIDGSKKKSSGRCYLHPGLVQWLLKFCHMVRLLPPSLFNFPSFLPHILSCYSKSLALYLCYLPFQNYSSLSSVLFNKIAWYRTQGNSGIIGHSQVTCFFHEANFRMFYYQATTRLIRQTVTNLYPPLKALKYNLDFMEGDIRRLGGS